MTTLEIPLLARSAQQIGSYRIVRLLGSGAMGAVYEALGAGGERVALKVMRENSAAALYRFKREFRALSGLVHKNLVTLYDLTVDSRHAYFTMELVEGTGFIDYVHASGVPAREKPERCLLYTSPSPRDS